MPYKIDVFESKNFVKVTYLGDVSLDERLSVIHDICRIPSKTIKDLKLIIDSRLSKNSMTDTEQEIFGTFVSTVDELKNTLVAVITDDVHVINKTAINISSQKGHKIKIFSTESEAMYWLNIEV